MKRNIYLQMKTLKEARAVFHEKFGTLRTSPQKILTIAGDNRVTCKPVFAARSVPSYHAAAMDGFAVRAEDTFSAAPERPLRLKISGHIMPVNTGDPIPTDTNAVIMIEHCRIIDNDNIEISKSAYPWENVRKVGEDIVATQLIIPGNRRLTPYDIGALLAAGVYEIEVYSLPKALIIPTGSELVPFTEKTKNELEPGRIIDFNSTVLSALAKRAGAKPVIHQIIKDNLEELVLALDNAIDKDFDLIVINAGSSAGTRDYTMEAINRLGKVFVHGITIMPGKPTIIGEIRGKPVIGNPGYPVSAIISFEQFAIPFIAQLMGQSELRSDKIWVETGRKLFSKLGMEEFIRVALGEVNNRIIAIPLTRGAGVITSLTRADGIIRIPQEIEGINEGEKTKAVLLRAEQPLSKNILMIGSHDNVIDIIANALKYKKDGFNLSSSHVGSLGGIMAIKKGRAHLAGSHLLDIDTGGYNKGYITRYLKNIPIRLINLVHREQGLIIPKGNPKKITGINDLVRQDITFINRQAGSGTRVLFDEQLREHKIDAKKINGYNNDEYTHMGVGVNVLSGAADAGMGIFAAAKALGLDFIPVTTERYDLIIPENIFNDLRIRAILDIISEPDFQKQILSLGGYDIKDTGKIMGIWDGKSFL